ncbi:hypothetical protein AAVH_21279 [Aphelenchoides avenae]|nr:hypothetical protein AAVH_21279 [Aphelenchus avenae]
MTAPDEGQTRPKRQYYNNYYNYGYSYPGYNNGYGYNYQGYNNGYSYGYGGYNNGYGGYYNGYYGNQGYGYGNNNGWYLASSNYQSHREPGSTSATGGFRCIGIDCFGDDEPKSCLRRWCMDG